MSYPPLNSLKALGDEIWIVDGPVIRFGAPWPKLPFPTRMTVIRIDEGLFIHSPTPLENNLKAEVERLGSLRWIIAPSRLHYGWVPEWRAAFPRADVYLAPRVAEQAGRHIDFAGHPLIRNRGYPWDEAILTLPVEGCYLTEVEFFHRRSRSLILTDLIENFDARRLSWWMRLLTRLGGVQHPGGMPRDMRLTFPREKLKQAVEQMIGWNPERVIFAHGDIYKQNGTAELKRAFAWLLD